MAASKLGLLSYGRCRGADQPFVRRSLLGRIGDLTMYGGTGRQSFVIAAAFRGQVRTVKAGPQRSGSRCSHWPNGSMMDMNATRHLNWLHRRTGRVRLVLRQQQNIVTAAMVTRREPCRRVPIATGANDRSP